MATPTTSRPRLRRLQLITALLLVLATGWWFWPLNEDPRFVGTWDWVDFLNNGRHGQLLLNANGTAVVIYFHTADAMQTHWRVDGDRLLLGADRWRQSRLVTDVDDVIQWLTGTSRFRLGGAYWQIVSMERDRVVLTSPPWHWTLTRAPEVGDF